MPDTAVPILSNLRAPDGRPAVEIGPGHPYYTPIDQTLKKSQGGPGMYESRKDPKTGEFRLYAALVPVTQTKRDPINEERTIDVPMLDEAGRVMMQRDPAARNSIALGNDVPGSDSLPTTPFPDSKDAMATGLEKLSQIVVDQGKQNMEMIAALVQALKEKR